MKATRDSFGDAIKELGAENSKIVVLDADLSVSTKSVSFSKAFPDRFFQMGIAEQNMIGTAAGLAFTGFVPFCCSFGCFLIGRYETIRVSIGYSNANVKLVGTHSGLGIGDDGYTQMGLEDMNLMRGLPRMTVINPADDLTAKEAVRFAASHEGPVYLRLTRQKLPNLYIKPGTFEWGKGIVVKEGSGKLALIGTGAGVAEALQASENLKDKNPWVIDIHTVKPIDRELIKKLASSCTQFVTVEDHNIIGGLGSAVAEVIAEENLNVKLLRLGVQDTYGESGEAKDLFEKYGFSANRITQTVKELF